FLILNIHKKLMSGVRDDIKGKIRNRQIVIGSHRENNKLVIKHNPPYHAKFKIEKALNELLIWFKDAKELSILKVGIFHHQFVYIHPFEDGNGRVCRLLTALLFLKH